jgi:uncharacterized protein YegP (UPF0339 family)
MSTTKQRKRFEIIRFNSRVFMWQLIGANQVVLCRSPRTYNCEANARRAIKAVRRMMSLAGVIVVNAEGKILKS